MQNSPKNKLNNKDFKNLSAFGQTAVCLDLELRALEELGGQFDRLDLETESDLKKAQQLLSKFSDCGQSIAEGVQKLAQAILTVQSQASQITSKVSDRSAQYQQRFQENQRLTQKFEALGELVKNVTHTVGRLKKPAGASFSESEKASLAEPLRQLDSQMEMLIHQAIELKNEASQARFKTLEKNANALSQSLQSTKTKLSAIIKSSFSLH